MKNLKFEYELWDKGIDLIAGIDEAGRGPIAGPLVVSAVILNKNHLYTAKSSVRNNDVSDILFDAYREINDSKLINKNKRQKLYDFIISNSICYSIVEIHPKEIDREGIAAANAHGFSIAVNKLSNVPEFVITDFFELKIPSYQNKQLNLIKGDQLSMSVAAASILAKVHRDNYMKKIHIQYPKYGFDKHKGYGTKLHKELIKKHGKCSIHRNSFKLKGID